MGGMDRRAPGTTPVPFSLIQNTPRFRNSSWESGSAAQGSHQFISQAYSVNTARMLDLYLLLEHVAVKILKAGFYVNRQIHAGWEFYRAIIGGLDASFLR